MSTSAKNGKMKQTCPSCGTQPRWKDPDDYGTMPGYWVCPRCKYKRAVGDCVNPWKIFRAKVRK